MNENSSLVPRLIAGPCSAESPEQLHTIASALKGLDLDYFRAGVWKPRTQPNCFEGIGKEALSWLLEIRKEYGYPLAIEVCLPEHADLALQAGIDLLWLGARTVANPYAVQSIAEVLRNSSTKVLVKNPISPDLSLWVGAIERLQKVGVSDIGAVFRGFSSSPLEEKRYRNAPYWSVAFELKRLFPHMMIYCDPSHITGKREEIEAMSQKAMDLGFEGLMIETHSDPEKAWSDARQQILPEELQRIMTCLQVKENKTKKNDLLEDYRLLLNESDEMLLSLLARRMNISKKIGAYKRSSQMPILQMEQFASILKSRTEMGLSMGLSPEFIERIIALIHEESVRVQIEENN